MIEEAAKLITHSRFLIAFTGAGISAESGVPTFRDKGGLWEKYKIEDVATPEAFKRNPGLVWEFYKMRMQLMKNARPNSAHLALTELENMGILKAVITQNIDNLHKMAGTKTVIELHGNIYSVKCSNCEYKENLLETRKLDEFLREEEIPKCPKCRSFIRPDVVWFGESLPQGTLQKAFKLAERADVCLVIGTSGQVFPAAYIPYIVKDSGGYVIEINPKESGITPIADLFLKGNAGEIMKLLLGKVKICLKNKKC
ncbi:NAD-dependent protein deacylase [Thermococcus sp. EP1]|uniref:NAD-dependent protein deacetylase n=1 Tax=Thermococcus sp. EP1 TaxID=1591054 RepID=UPI0006DA9D56|nr:NAD-dependent protein deacetylase [Thermococcus sp. EP1]KPU63004.1 NAD-dependent protein deacylase [Thermococcus sp. EP1]